METKPGSAPPANPSAPQTAAQINDPQTGQVDTPPPSNDPLPPKAAKTVIEGKTEREIALEKQLEEANAGKKKAELTAMEKEDEARRLKEAQIAAPAPTKKKTKRTGWTLLHPAEEE